jgi:hypothetical protein
MRIARRRRWLIAPRLRDVSARTLLALHTFMDRTDDRNCCQCAKAVRRDYDSYESFIAAIYPGDSRTMKIVYRISKRLFNQASWPILGSSMDTRWTLCCAMTCDSTRRIEARCDALVGPKTSRCMQGAGDQFSENLCTPRKSSHWVARRGHSASNRVFCSCA